MKDRKHVLWLTMAAVLVTAAAVVCLFWDTLAIYVAPKTVLTEALSQTYTDIRQRFADSPGRILLQGLDPEGKQTVDILLQTTDPVLGAFRYDMQIRTQPHKLYGKGTVGSTTKDLDISFYLDTDFMAVASDDLLNGSYYGITYDSFLQDIQSIPLLNWMLGDAVLQKWDASVQKIQENMALQNGIRIPQLPTVSETEFDVAMIALLAVPSNIEKTSVLVHGQRMECYRIAYQAKGEQVLKILEQFADFSDDRTASVTAAFYLCDKALVLADLTASADNTEYHVQLELGKDILSDPLKIDYSAKKDGVTHRTGVEIVTVQNGSDYHERWNISSSKGQPLAFSYVWTPATGQMRLSLKNGETADFTLEEAEKGFAVKAEDFSPLYAALTKQIPSRPYKGTVTVEKGTAFSAPAYINLDQWSMDDFLILLEGLGGMMGIDFS